MFKFLRKKKAQSTVEYAILIIIIIGALLSIQVYIKRGIQGRLRSAADDIGDQYKPGGMNITRTTKSHSKTNETYIGGTTRSELLEKETTNVQIYENILNVDQDYWG